MLNDLFKTLLLPTVLALAASGTSFGHTISYGFTDAGPGTVTIWFGSYHFFEEANADGEPNEGFLQIKGIGGNPFPLTDLDFNLVSGTTPAGLFNTYVSPGTEIYPVKLWQGATFNSTQPGAYSFFFNPDESIGGNPVAGHVFLPWDAGVQNGTFTLSAPTVGVPDGGTTVALLGMALFAVGVVAWKWRAKRS